MGFEYEEGNRLLFQFIEDHPEYAILSDPDLDGIFAASIIARATGAGISRIQYPKPSEIDSLKVSKSILVELPLSKGLTYIGRNILIDHHGPTPFIALYNGPEKAKEVFFNSGLRSVSKLAFEVLKGIITLDEKGVEILEAVDEIDSGTIVSPLADRMNKAFLLNSTREDVKKDLTLAIYEMDWSHIVKWVEEEADKWSLVEERIERLRESVRKRGDRIVYFTYNVVDPFEAAARRMVMFRIEEDFDDVVLCIGLRKNKPVSATIATRGLLNLNRVYEELRRNNGVRAGGRENVGGIQFKLDVSVEGVLNMIQKAVEKVSVS